MDTISNILENEMQQYAGQGANGYSYFVKNDTEKIMSVISKFKISERDFTDTTIVARIVGEVIIIDDDKTNKPLVDALVQAGIAREKIVLAYAGETLETA